MLTTKLLEQRSALASQMRSINDNPEGTNGDLSDAQDKQFTELRSQLETVEKQIDRQKLIDEAERRMEGTPVTDRGEADFDTECRRFSIVKAIAGKSGLTVDDAREREISAELERRNGVTADGIMVPMQTMETRVLTTSDPSTGPGSNLISTDYLGNQFIDRLRAGLVINRLGARTLNGLTGNIDIPRLKASATSGWVAENSALNASDHEFNKVSMTPKHAGALTELSRNMLQQASPDIEGLVRTDFAQILAEAVDRVAIQGGGSNEPNGVLATAGIQTLAEGASYIDTAADAIGLLDVANVGNTRAFLTSNGVRTDMLKQKDSDALPIPVGTQTHGERIEFSNLVPTDLGAGNDEHGFIYGDWSDLIIGYWSAFDLLVNPYESTAYSKGNVQVRAMLTCDMAVRHPESFVSVTGVQVA